MCCDSNSNKLCISWEVFIFENQYFFQSYAPHDSSTVLHPTLDNICEVPKNKSKINIKGDAR